MLHTGARSGEDFLSAFSVSRVAVLHVACRALAVFGTQCVILGVRACVHACV